MSIDFGFLIGWIGVGLGIAVPIPQLLKIRRTGGTKDISLKTYVFLISALACYLAHAIYIDSIVFTVAQSVNLTVNGVVLAYIWKGKR